MNKCVERLQNGIIKENPTFVMLIGMCPTLAVTTSAINGIGMGLSTTLVLVFSNLLISLLRKVIPDSCRVPGFIVVVASLVTIVQFLLEGYVPDLYASLGLYIPLIVVNCIILGRAEAFANKNTVLDSALDGIGMGVGFTMSLTLISLIREVFGSGTITLFAVGGFDGVIEIPGLHESPIGVLTLASGALLVMGYLKAFFQWKSSRGDK